MQRESLLKRFYQQRENDRGEKILKDFPAGREVRKEGDQSSLYGGMYSNGWRAGTRVQ